MEDKRKTRVFTGIIWQLGEKYFAQIVQFVVSIILARILMPEVYGTVALVTVFIAILQVFIDSGFGNALIQKKNADDLDFSTVFYFNVVICLFLYSAIFFLAPLISKFYNNSSLTIVIRVLSLTLVFSSLKNVQQAYVARNMQFRKFFIATLFGTIVSAVVGITMALRGYGVWAIVAQNLTNCAIDTFLLWCIVKWRPKLMFSFARLKDLFNYGWKLLASSLIETTYNNLWQLLIGKKYSANDLAYYNKGNSIPTLAVTNMTAAIDSVLVPTMSKEQDNKSLVKSMTRRSIKTATFIMSPMMIGLAVTSEGIIKLLLTTKWIACVPFMQICCLTYMFYPINIANLSSIRAIGRSDIYLKQEIIKKIVGLSLLFASIPFGVTAMALSMLVSCIISMFINSWPNKKLLGYTVSDQLKDILPNFLLSFFMGGCAWLVSLINAHYIFILILQVLVGVTVYIGGAFLLKNETLKYIFDILKDLFKSKTQKKMQSEQNTLHLESNYNEEIMEKKVLVTRSSMPSYEEYIEEIKDLWDSHWLTNMGPKHQKLQTELQDYLNVENIDLFTNGHMAIEIALQALKLKGEVITTPFTFVSTTNAIVRNGLTPVFCDINPNDYTMDVSKIEKLITDKTCAIMPVHVYGNICNVEEIEKIAKKYKLKVIYDSAHAFGIRYKNKGIGSFGDANCFSFHATKVFNTIEGGAVTFNDKNLGEALKSIKNFGLQSNGEIYEVGPNAKMNEFCAAMGLCNLRHINEEINKRKIVVTKYNELLSGIDGIKLNPTQENVQPNYSYYPIIIDESKFGSTRDEVFTELEKNNIIARKYFYPLTSSFACYNKLYDSTKTPVAMEISNRVLTLPLYADMELSVVEKICNIIISCKK